ncbi:hypothetical protein [Arthrobacter pigmenti]
MINGDSIADWLQSNVIFVLLMVAGISILVGAINKKTRDAMLVFCLSLVGLLFLTLASSWQQIGQWVQSVIS